MKCLQMEILLIRAIVFAVSLSGCFWHLIDVSRIYHSGETNVLVNFERDVMVPLPAVTICIDVNHAIREDYIIRRFPEIVNSSKFAESKNIVLGEYLRKLLLYEQLYEATLGYRDIFNSCLIMKPIAFEAEKSEDYIECDRISPIHEYLTYSKKCFLIASQLSGEDPKHFLVDHDTTLRDNGFPLFQILLNNEHLHLLVVFMQSRTVPFLGFMGGQTNGIHLNNSKYQSYTFSYSKTISELLKAPYQTMCRDYSEIGFKSLAHCIVSCKADYFLREFNGWHADIPAGGEQNLQVHYAELKLKENKTLDKMMAEQCLVRCGKQEDCTTEYFSMSSIGQFEREAEKKESQHLHGIFIYLPTGRNTRYSHSPRLHLIEYICYFASVFSLWFGFSIIAIAKVLIKAYQFYSGSNASETQSEAPYNVQMKGNL